MRYLAWSGPTILRSKTPELVEQELYATVIVYNLVRERIHQAAMKTNKDTRRISFLDSLRSKDKDVKIQTKAR